jgi:muramoyltetrapeptide carboxypeptidase
MHNDTISTVTEPLPSIGVAIVALGGYAPCEASVERGLSLLRNAGCRVVNYYDPAFKFQRFGGSDAARIAQLYAAIDDPSVDVVLALRGGYGLSRLLPALDYARIADSGKRLVGHSDFTALQMALLSETGAISFAGPMLCDDFTNEPPSGFMWNDFVRCVRGPAHRVTFDAAGSPDVDAGGTLWGGNLAILAHLTGSRYLPAIEDGILFVEDVNEHPYRVERMLLQLLHSGVLHRQRALILGDFSRYRLAEYDNGYDFQAMLDYLRQTLPLPVINGLPFGHMRDKVTLVVGCPATISSNGKTATLEMRDYPALAR